MGVFPVETYHHEHVIAGSTNNIRYTPKEPPGLLVSNELIAKEVGTAPLNHHCSNDFVFETFIVTVQGLDFRVLG